MFDEIIAAMKKALPGLRRAFKVYIAYSAEREEREFYDRYVAGVQLNIFITDIWNNQDKADEIAARALLLRQKRFGTAAVIASETLNGVETSE